MSFSQEDFARAERREVDGRQTYFLDGRAVCLGKIFKKSGEYCAFMAGYKTDHKGSGRCLIHGGRAGRPVTSGEKAIMAQLDLEKIRQQFLANEPELRNLNNEIAIIKSLTNELWQDYLAGTKDKAELREELREQMETASKLLKTINSRDTSLTVDSAKFLMLKAMDIAQDLFKIWFLSEEWKIENGCLVLNGLTGDDLVKAKLQEFFFRWRSVVELDVKN